METMNDILAPNVIDNSPNRELISVLKDQIKKSKESKFAIGYFFLSGFSLVREDFPDNYDTLPFLKIVMGNETTYPTKEELVAGYNLRELFKQRMIEDLQKKKLGEGQIEQLRTLKEFVGSNIIDVKLYEGSRLHAKLYLFLTDPDEKYTSPGLGVVGSSNFTSGGLTKNKELNVLLTAREEVIYLNQWFDNLWDEASEFREDLIKVIDYSGVLPESPYPQIGTLVDPQTLFKYLVYQWFEGRVLKLLKRDILMEFQIVGVMNAVNILNFYNGVILADSVGLGKSFMASAVIEEFLNGKHPDWLANNGKEPSVLLILPPSIISQWEELLLNSDYFFKGNKKELRSGYIRIYEVYDDSGEKLLGKIAFLSLGIFQNMKEGEVDRLAEKYDLFILDEAHRFRNKSTRRHKNARKLLKKSDNFPNKFMLLTATPLNNSIDDIFNLIRIFNDDRFTPFTVKGIPIADLMKQYRDLKKELRKRDDDKIRKDTKKVATEIKQKILDEIMVSRVRKYIMEQFKDIKVDGKPLVFKDPKPFSLEYSPFYTRPYGELIDLVTGKIDNILFEYTKLYGSRFVVFEGDDDENGKHYIEIADLFKLLLGKRLESGIYPFETTLRRIYEKEKMFYNIFKTQIDTIFSEDSLREIIKDAMGKAKIKKELEEVSVEYNVEERDEETWYDRLVKILLEYSEDLKEDGVEYSQLDKIKLGLNKIIQNLESDLRIMDGIIEKLDVIKEKDNGEYKTFGKIPKEDGIIELPIYRYVSDPKLSALKQIIGDPSQKSDKLENVDSLNRKKIIIFTQYKDTAYYLYHNLQDWASRETGLHTWLKDGKTDLIKIGLVTGDIDTSTKMNYLKRFAPVANSGYGEIERHGELEILISTDALSEGVNLQDADAVVNYDLPWNPMVIVQRVGRVNRIGNETDVYVVNFMPASEIEVIVGILSKLKEKISDITLIVGKETKILSPDEEITVETFGEKIKDYSRLSITELEQYGISEDFEKFLPEGMPQEQVDEYKLSNIIQYELGMTDKDFEDVKDMTDEPYYTFIHSDTGKVISVYEFYRGRYKIMKRVMSTTPVSNEISMETPLAFLDLMKGRARNPEKIESAITGLKTLKNETENIVEDLKEQYQQEQRGFLYQLYNALLVEREKAEEFKDRFTIVMTALQTIPYYLYTKEIKPKLTERNLIELNRENVTVKDFAGTVDTLFDFFSERGLVDIESLKLRVRHPGWWYEV